MLLHDRDVKAVKELLICLHNMAIEATVLPEPLVLSFRCVSAVASGIGAVLDTCEIGISEKERALREARAVVAENAMHALGATDIRKLLRRPRKKRKRGSGAHSAS